MHPETSSTGSSPSPIRGRTARGRSVEETSGSCERGSPMHASSGTRIGRSRSSSGPTASKDPYALRRSVLGACRILIESRVRLSLSRHLDLALAGYQEGSSGAMIPRDRAHAALLEFYRGRLQHLGEEIPLRTDSVRAALAASFDDPFDARLRMEALEAIRAGDEFTSLVRAHKRIKNI